MAASPVFHLNDESLAGDPRFAGMVEQLRAVPAIDSNASFNRYCRKACRLWREQVAAAVGEGSARFSELLELIERRRSNVIATSWGGVVITKHEPPSVEKWLVVRAGSYLALEMHEQKDEHLEVVEGAGLIVWRSHADEPLAVQAFAPGDRFHLPLGREHCLIGTENLLVFERSLDPKGMDQDLIFIYEPEEPS